MSEELRELFDRILDKDPETRITIPELKVIEMCGMFVSGSTQYD